MRSTPLTFPTRKYPASNVTEGPTCQNHCGMAVNPPRKPKLAELVPPEAFTRIQELGRRTRPRLAPSGRPTSVVTPSRRSDGRVAVGSGTVSAMAALSRASGATGGLGAAVASGAGRSTGARSVGRLTAGAGGCCAGADSIGLY